MKYVLLLLLTFSFLAIFFTMGASGRSALWRAARPYVFFALIAALAVVAVILVANGGGYLHIL